MKFHYPFKPFLVTQPWGNPSSMYSEHFNRPDWKRHNGIDAVGSLQYPYPTSYPVYCPADGFRVTQVAFQSGGGGHMVTLLSKNKVRMFDRECYAQIRFLHGEKIFSKVGDEPKVGAMLMVADNTGFSTGVHTHFDLYRMDYDTNGVLRKLDVNEAEGSFDPSLFWTGKFAVDVADFPTLFANNMRYYQYRITGS